MDRKKCLTNLDLATTDISTILDIIRKFNIQIKLIDLKYIIDQPKNEYEYLQYFEYPKPNMLHCKYLIKIINSILPTT